MSRGTVHWLWDEDEGARAEFEASLVAHEALGNEFGVERALFRLAALGAFQGQPDVRRLAERSLGLAQRVGDSFGEGVALSILGFEAIFAGERQRAAGVLARALDVFRRTGEPLVALTIEALSLLASTTDPECALRLAAGAAAIRDHYDYRRWPPALGRLMSDVREDAERVLGPPVAAAIWEEVRTAVPADVLVYAAAGLPTERSARITAALSSRESEVASLVATGLSNRQIAERLHVSTRTVESHVDHALTKLGLRSRTQLAAWLKARRSTEA